MKRISDFSVKGIILLALFSLALNLQAQNDASKTLPQFLFPTFAKGIVKMKAGNTYVATLNYNMVDEEMIFEQKGVYMTLDKPEEIDSVFFQNRKFVPFEKAFYEVLVKGPASFYIQNKSRYASAGTSTAYGMTSQVNARTNINSFTGGNQKRTLELPDNVTIEKATVNWVKKDNKMVRFTNERQFLKIFPERETMLKDFIKKEGLDVSVREDLIKIAVYCNSILL
jgi:hypothetical protein